MADKETVCTPSEKLAGEGSTKGGPGTYNGEPGYPPRTPSPNAVPEKTYEEGKLNISKEDRGSTFVTTPAKPPYGDKK